MNPAGTCRSTSLRLAHGADLTSFWVDTIEWDDVAQPLLDADLVARDVVPQPDGTYRDRLRITDLGRRENRQIEAEIERSPWIHSDDL